MPYIQFKELEMFYEKMGVGEPIIFLHSGYSKGIIAFSCQLLDFQKIISTPQLADDILDFMDGLGISKAHFYHYRPRRPLPGWSREGMNPLRTMEGDVLLFGCSHRPHMLRENPILVNDTILRFLKSNPIM